MAGEAVTAQAGGSVCQWCGGEAISEVIVEPEVVSSVGGVKVLKRRAITATVCADHKAMVEREEVRTEHRRARERLRKLSHKRELTEREQRNLRRAEEALAE